MGKGKKVITRPSWCPDHIKFMGKKVQIWEDIDNKFQRACLAEFLAMHLFVLLCCGCAMVTLNLPNPNLMMVAASFGFGIMCLATIFGSLSGGHINSAVSLGLFVAGRTSLVKTICYTLSQMLGSVWGALMLWHIFGTNWPAARAFGSNSYDATVFTGGQVFFAEMLGTGLLMFNVLSTIDIPGGEGGALGVYPIAMSVMVAHLFLLPIDGCSINPTRSFGPALVANWANIPGNFANQQHIFWFGPMFGAACAALLYEYGTLKPANFEGAKDMDTALFSAGKKTTGKRKVKKVVAAVEDEVVSEPAHVEEQPKPKPKRKVLKSKSPSPTESGAGDLESGATSNPLLAAASPSDPVTTDKPKKKIIIKKVKKVKPPATEDGTIGGGSVAEATPQPLPLVDSSIVDVSTTSDTDML